MEYKKEGKEKKRGKKRDVGGEFFFFKRETAYEISA